MSRKEAFQMIRDSVLFGLAAGGVVLLALVIGDAFLG